MPARWETRPSDQHAQTGFIVATGTVRWFDSSKGYGFITQDNGGDDVFCHHSALVMEGFRELTQGQKVKFDVVSGRKGPQAESVTVLS